MTKKENSINHCDKLTPGPVSLLKGDLPRLLQPWEGGGAWFAQTAGLYLSGASATTVGRTGAPGQL